MKTTLHHHRPDAREQRRLRRHGFFLGGVLLLAAVSLGLGWRMEQVAAARQTRGDLAARAPARPVLTHDGRQYRLRDGLTNLLLIGTDQPEDPAGAPGAGGPEDADFLLLLVFDRERGEITPLEIDRDTLVALPPADTATSSAEAKRTRICHSYAAGADDQAHCAATVAAVSGLLMGIDIPLYIAMDYGAIATLNDLLGGVEVTLDEDFSRLDAAMRRGVTLTLRGEQARYYLQYRQNIGPGTNVSRMARQRVYVRAAAALLRQRTAEDSRFPERLYDRMQPLWHTNLTRGRMVNEAYAARDYALREPVSLAGTYHTLKDGTVTFQAAEAPLTETILTLFFEPEEGT